MEAYYCQWSVFTCGLKKKKKSYLGVTRNSYVTFKHERIQEFDHDCIQAYNH